MERLGKMTLGALTKLETARYQRYTDQYDHAGMDTALRAELDEARNEIQTRREHPFFVADDDYLGDSSSRFC
jgi:hypothetical protein